MIFNLTIEVNTPSARNNARLTPARTGLSGWRRDGNHYFWEFLMLFLAVFCGFLTA